MNEKKSGQNRSDKKSTNKDKSQSNDHLRKIVDNIDHEFLWSSPSLFDYKGTYYSNGIKDVTGYTADEVKSFPGRGFHLIDEKDKEFVKNKFEEFVENKDQKNLKIDYRIRNKNGKIIWVKENIAVERDKEGNPKYFYGTISDITDLKEAEVKIKESEVKLRELNDSKDKFISILSHDLRAPFTSILGFSEILMNEPNLSDAERNEYLTYINDSSQNQLQLINYLLDWSRLQTGRIKLDPQRLHAQSIVYNCVSSLTGNAIRKNIDIKVDVEESIFVKADERLLTQVITNLLSNAIKFSLENKVIEISASNFNPDLIEIVVKDKGIGIPDRNQIKLFLIDHMFTTEGTKGEKGTGLGLPLVKEIIDKHGGDIWFYSESNEGSEFHFTIPSAQNNIVVINDKEKEVKKIKNIIEKDFSSFNSIFFKNGFEALENFEDELPSLIILNHELELMNGIKFLETLEKTEKKFNIPVIVIAGEISNENENMYKDLEVDDIIKKPIDDKLLIDAINVALK